MLKTISPKIWQVAVLMSFPFESSLLGQDFAAEDSTRTEHAQMVHHVEAGINPVGILVEYRYQWMPYFSTDAMISPFSPAIGMGVTLSPIWFFFVQGVLGKGTDKEQWTLDWPPGFKADYFYGWNAGVRLPINPMKTRVYILLGVGQTKYVQKRYQYNGGGFLIGPPPAPLYRTETRLTEIR